MGGFQVSLRLIYNASFIWRLQRKLGPHNRGGLSIWFTGKFPGAPPPKVIRGLPGAPMYTPINPQIEMEIYRNLNKSSTDVTMVNITKLLDQMRSNEPIIVPDQQ